jgi:hypothetical protein
MKKMIRPTEMIRITADPCNEQVPYTFKMNGEDREYICLFLIFRRR